MKILIKVVKRIAETIGVFCVPVMIMDTIGHPSMVQGSSMEPTLFGSDSRWYRRDTVWVNKLKRVPNVGDIFIFIYPRDITRTHIKRVAHEPGDVIRLRDSQYFKVPNNHFWVVSDNPSTGCDSYIYGPVNSGLIKGKATRIIWPPNRWRKL